MYGWAGTTLWVDLTAGKLFKESTAKYARGYVGGRGINARLLYDEARPGIEAFNPDTPLIFGVGPLVGTGAPLSARTEVTSRSPLSLKLIAHASFGGYWGPELKFSGYDNLIVKGRAEKPTYIFIDNDTVELKDGGNIWGKDTLEAQKIILEELRDPEVKVACIGIAGEKLVNFASIIHDYECSATQGLGAVMGFKNLKAVAVRGSREINIFNPERFLEIYESFRAKLDRNEWVNKIVGAGFSWEISDHYIKEKSGVVGNFEGHEWAGLENVRGEPFVEKYSIGRTGCFGCPVNCRHLIVVPGVGKNAMTCIDFFTLSPLVWNPEVKLMFEGTVLCDRYGIDHQYMGYVIAWLMHLYNEGIITEKDTDGIPMERGSKEAILAAIHKTANREGFGDTLAEGILKAAQSFGREAEKYAIHIRGNAQDNDPHRPFRGYALAAAISSRGDFMRHYPRVAKRSFKDLEKESIRVEKMFGTLKVMNPLEYKGKGKVVAYYSNVAIIADMIGICRWATNIWLMDESTRLNEPIQIPVALYSAATGADTNIERFFEVAERISALERSFLVREGLTRKDDTLPDRFFKEPVSDGPFKGEVLDRNLFEMMKDEYYTAKGWDIANGIPTIKRLEALDLKDIAEELEKMKRIPIKT